MPAAAPPPPAAPPLSPAAALRLADPVGPPAGGRVPAGVAMWAVGRGGPRGCPRTGVGDLSGWEEGVVRLGGMRGEDGLQRLERPARGVAWQEPPLGGGQSGQAPGKWDERECTPSGWKGGTIGGGGATRSGGKASAILGGGLVVTIRGTGGTRSGPRGRGGGGDGDGSDSRQAAHLPCGDTLHRHGAVLVERALAGTSGDRQPIDRSE